MRAPSPVEVIECTVPTATPRTSTSAPVCNWLPASGTCSPTSMVDVKSLR